MFQVRASVQPGAAEAATFQQRSPGKDVSRKCNSENRPRLYPGRSVTHELGKFSLGLSQELSGVRPCARAVLYSETISSTTACRASPSLSPSSTWAAGAGDATCGIDRSWLRRTTILPEWSGR